MIAGFYATEHADQGRNASERRHQLHSSRSLDKAEESGGELRAATSPEPLHGGPGFHLSDVLH